MSDTISCASCGNAFAKGDKFCPKCGTAAGLGPDTSGNLDTRVGVDISTVCVKCSASMASDARFCPKCGTGRPEEATVVSHVSLRNAQAAHLAEVTQGEFEVLQQLGLGAMGSVYLAKDVALSRNVAIKVIASNLLQDESMVSRFRLEAQTVASLRHPSIVNIHGVRQADDLHYFVMDFIDGPSLRSIVKSHAPLEIPVVQALLYQIGSALDYAHHSGRGVIHRDIKPANIMVDREGNAFVTDFGISKITESQTGLTQTGATIGTPEYMSPEQCRGEDLTGASDQYAVGIMAYEMLTGKTPFSGSQYFIMVAHTSEEATPISELRPDCPPHVAEAVHRMLAKAPDDRWPDLESGMAAMGGAPLGRKDPIRQRITALAGSTGEVRALGTTAPLSPLPGRSTGDSAPGPTTATSVTVLGVPARVEEGDAFQLSADVRGGAQGSIPGVSVAWSSTDPAIAVVTGGNVKALKAGTAVISAAVDGIANSVSLHVVPAAAVAVMIDPETVHVSSGERVSLQAHVQDRNGRELERTIRWLTSDAGVASVTREGELVATGSGVATVTAESGGVTGTAEIVVQGTGVRVPVGLRRPKRAFYRHPAAIGGALLAAGVAGVFGAMSMGLFGGEGAAGDVGDGVVVGSAIAAIVLSPSLDTIQVGDTLRLTAQARDEDGAEVEGGLMAWTTNDDAIVQIGEDGIIVAQAAGPVTITAMLDGIEGLANLVVVDVPTQVASTSTRPPVSSPPATRQPEPEVTRPPAEETRRPATLPRVPANLEFRVPESTMILGRSQRVSLGVLDASGVRMPNVLSDVSLRSSNEDVLTIDREGLVTAVGAGATEIEARLGPLSRSLRIAVEAPVEAVEIQGGDVSLVAGDDANLDVSVSGPNGFPLPPVVSWTSSNEAVVSVDITGRISAVSAGTALITADANGITDDVTVTVAAPAARLPSAGDVQGLLAGYASLLEDGDEDPIRDLHGGDADEQRDELLDLMDNRGFEAEIQEVGGATLEGGAATVIFSAKMSYRGSFGGGSETTRQFRATLTPAGGGWQLASVVLLPG